MEWDTGAPAMLRVGGLFDAVRIPSEVVRAAARSNDWAVIDGFLGEVLDGPVIHDPHRWFYALVPPRTTEAWRSPFARCLGGGAWLGVPRTDRTTLETSDPYWSVPLKSAGDLCSPHAVSELIDLGHRRLVEGAR
ncbi:hypothetical protein [Streptomyces spiramyceticus]|uniref:hypothetical protein n=1 Tax=Streptomyces spiramyceticus TaxID=299717 RepID=UPI00237AB3CE|nr:hypothetical protein [Streptomyces spiramyceticus]